jgi:hypothetical protein
MISGKDGYKPVAFFLRVPPASLGAVANYGKTVAGMGQIQIPWTGEFVKTDLAYVITRIEFEHRQLERFGEKAGQAWPHRSGHRSGFAAHFDR